MTPGRTSSPLRPVRPTWALSLLLLALLSAADAACTDGYLKLDLVSVSGGGSCDSSLLATCLPSLRVSISAACVVSLTPLLVTSTTLVPAIWSTNPGGTYAQLSSCPTAATTAVDPGSSPSQAQLKAAIEAAFEQHIYGADYQQAVTSVTWTSGTVSLLTTSGSCTLKYAVTEVSPSDSAYTSQIGADAAPAVCDISGSLVDGGECMMNLADSCAAGRRPVELPSGGKACALCRAGSSSATGAGCTACATGKYVASVGAASCTASCAAGTYASGGNSACVPCSPGTYQDATAQAGCNPCPSQSYARLPGATQCVRCVAGVAKCVAGSDVGCNPANAEVPSPGYQVLSVTSASSLPQGSCALGGSFSFAAPPLFGRCSLVTSCATWLTLYVDAYCGVAISPLKDTACAEPGASYWSDTRIAAHYVTPSLIATRFNPAATSPISSYMLSLVPAGSDTLTLSYWAATTNVSLAASVSASSTVCTGTTTVVGGQVAGLPASPVACPVGTYDDDAVVDGCRPCPVGAGCNASATAPTLCAADTFQPYLGQQTSACQTCNASASPRLTSNSGDDYCTVPWIDQQCTNGYEYNKLTTTCDICPAGTQRMVGRETLCTPCSPGYYSAQGATNCTACPVDQYAPVFGLAERSTGDRKCIYCPTGSVAQTQAGVVGQTGSTKCSACQPGTVAAITPPLLYATCQACSDGFYRSGSAAANNNVCLQIPPGRKEVARANATYPRAAITFCSKGEVSFWSSNVRTPIDPQACQPCTGDNKVAPRTGMSACSPCRAGTAPGKSLVSLPGNDACNPCIGNTYRPASSTSPTCLVCNAGRETESSGHAACMPCSAGYFMPDADAGTNTSKPAASGACQPCATNSYQPLTGQASCRACAAGTSTEDTASTACAPCAYGYFSPTAATPCVAAPQGAFVNITGATSYTPCPKGTFNNQLGADECDVCPAGQYSSTTGSRACRTCGAGTWSPGGSPTCRRCGAGFYSSAGSSSCNPCKPGSFSPVLGSSSCQACPLGRQCPSLATKTPIPCPKGQYSNRQGARLCSLCPTNTYQDVVGQQGCKQCPSGFHTRGLTGQSLCQQMRSSPIRRLLRQ